MAQRLIDADALYEQIAKKEKLAQQRVLDTPSQMTNGDLNPSAIRYFTQLDERTQMKFMIADAPTIDAVPERTGTWTEEYDPDADLFFRRRYRCSACNGWNTYGFTTYCPQCGAWMVNSTAVMMAKQKETGDAETD